MFSQLQELSDLVKNLDKVKMSDRDAELKEYPNSSSEGMDHNDVMIKRDDEKMITKYFDKTENQELLNWDEEEEISHLASPEKWCNLSSSDGLFDQSSGTSNWWDS